MDKPRNDLKDRLVYLCLRLLSTLVHCWPVNFNLQAARLLGSIWYRLDAKHRARAIANLHRSFPHFTEQQCDTYAHRSQQHMFMLAVEVLFTTRLIRIDTWRDYVEIQNIQQTLRLLMDRNRGLILLTAHYGNWEILGYVLATLGFETTSVARAFDNPYINDCIFGVRESRGQKVLDKFGATEQVTSILENGGVVAFVADQNAGKKGIFVDFFGRKASTYKSIGLLAMQYEVPIVIGFARRLNERFHFSVEIQDIIYPADWKDQPDSLRYITQRYTTGIENFIRADPGQYLWTHRRWKTRPKGEEPQQYD
ncbi:MAG: lysophospholipid acyltransferase family protein [Planctomycetota bacterium]|nr:lysophospholipid acyltransferase family protein [Planctomycetota bacterium]